MENIYWKKTVGTLIGAIWLYTLADIAASIAGAVNEILNPSGALGMIKDLMEGGSGAPSLSTGDIIESTFSIIVLAGYNLFFRSLTRFARLQSNKQDGEYVSTVRTAYILLVIAIIVDFIPFIGWLASFVIMVIAYVKMLSGYRGLKKSTTFPAEACQGASTLYSCTIWTLVGYVLGCIPLLGGVIEGIITLVVFFTVLSAWGRIKNGAPELTPEEEEAFRRDEAIKRAEVPAYKQILGDALILNFFIVVANIILTEVFSMYQDASSSPWLFKGFQLSWSFAIIAIWARLFSSKVRLNLGAKIGLGILLLGNIMYVICLFIPAQMIADASLSDLINTTILLCHSIGILLFIWFTSATLSIKITVTANVVMMRLLWNIFYKMQFESLQVNDPGNYEAIGRLTSICSLINLGIALITLVLVYYFVSRWRKQPTDINTANN